MANDALFEMLAQAKGQPDRWARALNTGAQAGGNILGGYLWGKELKTKQQEESLKPFEIWSKISDAAGPDVANSIFKQRGIPIPDMSGGGMGVQRTPEELARMGGGWATKQLANQNVLEEMKKRHQELENIAPLTPDQALKFGVNPDVVASFAGKPIPRQVAQMDLTRQAQGGRTEALSRIAGSREAQVGLGATKAAMQYGGAGAAQPMIRQSFERLGNIERAKGLLQQIMAQGGKANIQQRAELSTSVARTLNPSGVMTNEALNLFMPQTALGKYGNFLQYIANEPGDVDFTAFASRFSDLLDREKRINEGITRSAGQYAEPFQKFGSNVVPQAPFGGSNQNPNISTGIPGQEYDPLGLLGAKR